MRCFSLKETAKLIGIGVSTLYLWIERGQAPRVTKVGGRVFVFEKHFLEWMADLEAKQP